MAEFELDLVSGKIYIYFFHKFKIKTDLPDVFDIIVSPAVAGQCDVADLGVQGEQLQAHRTAQSEGDLSK